MRHDVRVGVHRLIYPGVAEDLLENFHRLVGLHPQRGEGVSEGVEPRLFGQAGFPGERFEVAEEEVVAVHGAAGLGGV